MSLTMWLPWVIIMIGQTFFQSSLGEWFITYILHYLPYVTTSASLFLALIGISATRKKLQTTKLSNITFLKATSL
jgi:hypothetical protein